MNYYVFEKASSNSIRAFWLESDNNGCKSVANILEMKFDGSKESLKKTVKCVYEMLFVGEQPDDSNGYKIQVINEEYDASLEGKARKQSSKEINVISEQLWSFFS